MPLWVPALLGGISTLLGADAADDAADSEAAGSQAAIDEQRRQFNLIYGRSQPYQNVGSQAISNLGSIYGYDATRDPVGNAVTQNELLRTGSGGYGGTPLNQADWQAVNSVWGNIRNAANYGDISQQHLPQGITPEASQFLSQNWGNIRRAANFGDINWNNGVVGTPGYQQAQITGAPNATVGRPTASGGWDNNALFSGSETAPMPGAASGAPAAGPDYSSFFKSPDYEFRRGEGLRGIENSFAARGGAQSGNALRALTEFNSNLAAGEFGNYFNRQSALAGIGQAATGQSGAAGMNAAANIGNAQMNAGASRASGILGRNAAIAGGITQGYENWLYGRPWRGAQTQGSRGGSWG